MGQTKNTVRAIERMLNAKSLAVVGASSDPRKFGHMTLKSIIEGGYEGDIFPVNPKGGRILGLDTYPAIREIPQDIDAVVVLVPARFVPEILRDSAAAGAAGAVVCSGGFGEAGRTDLEAEIAEVCRETGLRVVGPNIVGLTYPPNKLCAVFYPVITTQGPLAIVSQSGTISNALSEWAADEGLGISAAMNLGNQVDLCESDFLDFLAVDPNTKAVAMYLEGVVDGRRFLQTLARATAVKPVVILKGGRTAVGKRSAASHTGALAANDGVFCSACRQCGAIMAPDLESLYDYSKAMATMRSPKGNRVFSLSSSGGAGILAADAMDGQGLVMPDLPKALQEKVKELPLSPLATLSNPFDTGADLDVGHFQQVATLVHESGLSDVVFLNLGDPVAGAPTMVEELLQRIDASLAVAYFAGGQEEKAGRPQLHAVGIPVFPTPERAIRGISAAVRHAQYRRTRGSRPMEFPAIAPAVGKRGKGEKVFLPETRGIEYLDQYGIPYPEHGIAHSSEEATEIANQIGYPVTLKVVSPDIPHKSDIGGVALGVEGPSEVPREYERISELAEIHAPKSKIDGILVCEQVPEGIEVLVGAIQDSVFGPTVVFGLGGIYTEILGDVSFRVAPLDRFDAEEMMQEIRGYGILRGARGKNKYDLGRLGEVLISVSHLAIDHPEIEELDINPIRLFGKELMALDVAVFRTKGARPSTSLK